MVHIQNLFPNTLDGVPLGVDQSSNLHKMHFKLNWQSKILKKSFQLGGLWWRKRIRNVMSAKCLSFFLSLHHFLIYVNLELL